MSPLALRLSVVAFWLSCATALLPQPPAATMLTTVPRVVRVSSSYRPMNGSMPAPVESATLAIYRDEIGGTPLWQEMQNVTIDADGRYSLLLGSTRNEGLPVELFTTGEQRWLGVQFQRVGEMEQRRILLASVPYALKAADADTLGGRPASAYVLNPSAEIFGSTANVAAESETPATRRSSGKPAPRVVASNYVPMYTDIFGSTMDSVMFQNSGQIGLNTTNPLDYMHVVFTDPNGIRTGLAVQNTSGASNAYSGMLFYDQNGAIGQFQGFNNSTHEYRINNIAKNGSNQFNGSINFMIGSSSKFLVGTDGDVDISGSIRKNGNLLVLSDLNNGNTALGLNALVSASEHNTTQENTAVGAGALLRNNGGAQNTAMGFESLLSNTTGSSNTAIGPLAMLLNTTGSNNTALGSNTLAQNNGNNNIAIGYLAGSSLTQGSNNILIGYDPVGLPLLSNTIIIGNPANQNRTFINAIRGVTTGNANAVPVLIDSSNQLGTMSSSRRHKEDIQDMGDTSSRLLRLRAVTFRYKKPYNDGSKPIDYGLVAEEVAEVYPDLVVRNKDGQIETVQYQKLTPMLLNELQKQNETIRTLQEQNRWQSEKNQSLENRLAAVEALLSGKGAATASAGQ